MDGNQHRPDDPFVAFDGRRVPESWLPDLSRTLLELGQAIGPIDQPILAPLTSHLARHQQVLRTQAAVPAHVEPPPEIHQRHPGSATLFRFQHGRSAGLELLTCIGLCALLEAGGTERARRMRLLSVIRGAMGTPGSPLTGALGAISSVPELMRVVNDDEGVRSALPPHFLMLWDQWLSDTLARWMHANAPQMRRALEPSTLTTGIDDRKVEVSFAGEMIEDGASLLCNNVPPSDPAAESMTTARVGRAASNQLDRESTGDLIAAPEQRLPRALDERLCRESIRGAIRHADDAVRAEPLVALALVLAGGVREIDLRTVVWGGQDAAWPLAIDPLAPVMYRRLKRPPNAVIPPKCLSDEWLMPCAEVMEWPLPTSVHAALVGLADGAPRPGEGVLPMLAASPTFLYRMRDVIAQLVPEARVGALAARLALASEISAALGTEMAQLTMGDTFSMSSIPAYYSALPGEELASVIAGIQSRRFGEHIPMPEGRVGYVGSRLVLADQAAQCWPTSLKRELKAASRQPEGWLEAWRAHRDHLVAALCSATGHRPEDALGRIALWDVIPEYGLIILRDKQVDALRAARIAATGYLWLSDLRRYIDRLIDIAAQHSNEPAGQLADAILRNEASLFSLPANDGSVAQMSAALLRAGMPDELQAVDNFFRHRLNQCLLARRVDPELRHAQLGWVVSPAHFHSDLSPRSPVDLGRDLAPVIDDVLVTDGWYTPSARKRRWTWEGVPMPPPVDWEAAFASEKRKHEEALKQVKLRLREQWKEVEGPVMARLADAFREFCPLLRIDGDMKSLVRIHGGNTPVELGADHHALIRDRVRQGDKEPASGLEAAAAAILLYRLVRRARDKGIIQGPIPGRPYLSVTSDPSPFVPGLGAAVRHAHAVRDDLQARAGIRQVQELGQLTVWSILAFSMYRRMPWARAATHAARTAMRANARRHVVRIDARVEGEAMHMVFSGVPAILLARRKQRAPTSPAPMQEALNTWALKHLCDQVAWGEPTLASGRIESALAAAGQVELSGVERLLVQMGTQTAAGSPVRCIARDDNWPVLTLDGASIEECARGVEPPATETERPKISSGSGLKGYNQLVALLNKRKFAQRRAGKSTRRRTTSDGQRAWRRALRAELEDLREKLADDQNLMLLIAYSLDHLRHGSEDGHRLTQNSLRREVSSIGRPLLVLASENSLLTLSAEGLNRLYRQVILSKSDENKPYAFRELARFHRFLMRMHARPAVDMAELSLLAGSPQRRTEPGLLTQAEVRAVEEELRADFEREAEREDAGPDFLRLAQLRRLHFLILEASGVRPGSAYGLTLGDIHLLDGGDYVHVRKGEFGEAKTRTSLGFVRLEGPLWNLHRSSVKDWIEEERRFHPEDWRELPIFGARLGGRTRVHEHHLYSRINELLKWVTGNRDASCYWLRKSRVSARYQTLVNTGMPSARDVYRAMIESGHAWIQTPVERYVNDPGSLMFAEVRTGCEAPRALMLAMSCLDHGPVDVAWHRTEKDGRSKMGVVLDRLDARVVDVPVEHRTPAPALRRFKPLAPVHVDAFARALRRHKNVADAVLESGLTATQAGQFQTAAESLLVMRGCAPWRVDGASARRYVIPPPRRIAGTETLFSLLDKEPSRSLKDIAKSWVQQSHAQRLHDQDTFMQVEDAQLAAMLALLDETGLEMSVVSVDGKQLLKAVQRGQHKHGHAAAFRWVLAIVWIYTHSSLE